MKKRETCAYTGVYIYILADYCLVDLRIGSACARNNFKRVSFRNSKSDRAFFRRRRRCCCPDTHNIILFRLHWIFFIVLLAAYFQLRLLIQMPGI